MEDAENLFDDFLQEHKKVYNRREYNERLAIFKKTLKHINEQNEKFPDTVFAINHFADLKPHELECYRGFKLPKDINLTKVEITEGLGSAPESFDWRQQNKVTHVKDQGQCGSCYIFSAVGDIEGQYAIKHGQLVSLSEEQALDCLTVGSCFGGDSHEVMQELAKRPMKLEREDNYPYTEPPKRDCHHDPSKGVVQCTSGKKLSIMDEEQLKTQLHKRGPMSIALNAADFDYYTKGILIPNVCKGQDPNHGVLLVGYGEENGKKFWIIKNSWGQWGEDGYVRMLRGVNACGIGTYIAESTVA
ncbi:procathepsin L-like [Cydia splendana]|uniref:procathepsin L-like n=1 Tax=Cydia splendana TaxID=1100963 RepID=UPI00300D9C84